MEFHLLYSGPLHSAGSEGQRQEKHAIRKLFHPQLRHLWEFHPNLRELAEGTGHTPRPLGVSNEEVARARVSDFENGLRIMGRNWNRATFNFLPLVTKEARLRCGLDILFLRAEEKNYVLQGGDIDGRIKVLFDALRIVREAHELPPGEQPESTEDPFFCLLEDDELISEVHINTDRLLNLPEHREIEKADVYLQITVRLNTTVRNAHTWVFE